MALGLGHLTGDHFYTFKNKPIFSLLKDFWKYRLLHNLIFKAAIAWTHKRRNQR